MRRSEVTRESLWKRVGSGSLRKASSGVKREAVRPARTVDEVSTGLHQPPSWAKESSVPEKPKPPGIRGLIGDEQGD